MQHNFENTSFLVGNITALQQMNSVCAHSLFDEEIIDFLNSLAKRLFLNTLAKTYPDVISFAFWCRKSSVLGMKQGYPDLSTRCGRGVAFHIAPSNVAVNFAYSLVAGLLSGNANVVRVPSRDFQQVEIICHEIKMALQEHPQVSPYICLIRYERDKATNDWLSARCHSRLIWGGDATIMALRESPMPARSIDITFANRYSFALVDAAHYLSVPDKRAVAEHFYNDTFLTDQNACTSPGLIIWLGRDDEVNSARATFWAEFEAFSQERYILQEAVAIKKLTQFCLLSSAREGVTKVSGDRNLVYRVQLDSLDEETMSFTGAGGYFMEYLAHDISEIYPVCDERCQTISVLGITNNTLATFLSQYHPKGVDRIVPMGRSMDFSLQWDGYDLIYTLSRTINLTLALLNK
ncbi:acyl-CoA reductase [Candidatus Symbiopectobacterium sp.]|uniref:acyl-CoA reductase n=1 Tax=Candidatus Symbiopectobacterium sp. TaxID=2816440 RepID=UPI0025BB33CC|nr:acyl-CoA reductase [Candidatus Symbiopectobacterium sp.]